LPIVFLLTFRADVGFRRRSCADGRAVMVRAFLRRVAETIVLRSILDRSRVPSVHCRDT